MIAELISRFGRVEDTPAGVLEDALRRIQEVDHVFTSVAAAEARERAAASTERWLEGRPAGYLDGLPVAVKDCIDVAGMPTTNGSVVDASPAPAARDAGIVQLLRANGAVDRKSVV